MIRFLPVILMCQKIKTKIIITFALLCLLISCAQESERRYYEDGNLKFEAPLKNGLREGKSIDYFKNGNIRGYANWKSGKLEGKSAIYYLNGKLELENYFKNGVRCHESLFYRDDGSLKEIQYLGENGKLRDFKKFNKDGTQNTAEQTRRPVILSERDTIQLGNFYISEIRLGNRKFNSIDVIIGSLSDKKLINKFKLPKKNSFTALLEIKALTLGENKFEGIILEQNPKHPDSVLIIPFRHSFHVRE